MKPTRIFCPRCGRYENRDGDASWRAGHLIGPYAVGDSPSIDEAKRAASKAVAERIIAGLELMP